MIQHNYQSLEGWFNMEKQYLELMDNTPDGGLFVEVGAYKGKSTSFIVTEMVNQNKNAVFYTIDSFEGATGSNDEKEVEAYKAVKVDEMYEEFLKNTAHLREYFFTMKEMSDKAASYFKDNSVDSLFLDAGHSKDAVLRDIKAWLPKMKNGGIMAGHDYISWKGVSSAVNEVFGKPDKVENDCWFVKIKK